MVTPERIGWQRPHSQTMAGCLQAVSVGSPRLFRCRSRCRRSPGVGSVAGFAVSRVPRCCLSGAVFFSSRGFPCRLPSLFRRCGSARHGHSIYLSLRAFFFAAPVPLSRGSAVHEARGRRREGCRCDRFLPISTPIGERPRNLAALRRRAGARHRPRRTTWGSGPGACSAAVLIDCGCIDSGSYPSRSS
jgi:hypothetical protein